ncbi:hypothetical protein SAY87_011298 [Trapa incisa]|uniref:Uncharacterized protein n=1 Tax=Trapa incisa TaxID=236973 RepID=A0AAN7GFW2_9MYRT|nr:hypothetical protein SAY87_011298 [Trapa incisa]
MNLQKLVKEQDKSRSKKEKGNVSLCHPLPLPLFFYRSKDLGWHLTVALRRLTEKELRNNGLHCPGSEFYYVMGSLFSVKVSETLSIFMLHKPTSSTILNKWDLRRETFGNLLFPVLSEVNLQTTSALYRGG